MKRLIFIFLLSLYSLANAQQPPIQELKNSKEFYNIQKSKKHREGALPARINRDGGYAQIFLQKNGHKLIQEWLGKPKSFRVGSPIISTKGEYLEYLQKFLLDRDKFQLRLIIPKPHHIDAADFSLLPELLQFESPKISVLSEEPILLNESVDAEFVVYNERSCAVRKRLPKKSIIFINSVECRDQGLVKQLANVLSIKTLSQKLDE